MIPDELKTKLLSIGQTDLLSYYETYNPEQKKQLLSQIQNLDVETLIKQKKLLDANQIDIDPVISPLKAFSTIQRDKHYIKGKELLSKKKCGCLLVAGGQGSRLQHEGPKGVFPVSLIKHKSLFQLFAEKTKAAGKQVNCQLPLAIMTSPLNHNETVSYFKSNHYFGLEPNQVDFYSQPMLPLFNDKGNLFLDAPASIAFGPDGNGSALKSFVDSGIWQKWNHEGVENIHFVLVDNVLADPFDAELLGFHTAQKSDVTIKSTFRLNEKEKVGLLVEQNGNILVREYSEIQESDKIARLPDGRLKYSCANLSLFCIQMDFIRHFTDNHYSKMPLHKAHKAVKYLDSQGISKVPVQPNAWKFERFIFDILPYTERVGVLIYPRNICFAPLKNLHGEDSLKTVQASLQNIDKLIIEEITQQPAPQEPFELSQDFYYPTLELLIKWQGQKAPNIPYIIA